VGIGFIDFVSVIGNMFDGEVNGACDRYNSFNDVDLRVPRSLFFADKSRRIRIFELWQVFARTGSILLLMRCFLAYHKSGYGFGFSLVWVM
jgi:hypothetical protein